MGHVGQGGSSELHGRNPRVLSKMGESRLSLHVTRTCLPLTDDHGGVRVPRLRSGLWESSSPVVCVLRFALFLFPTRSSDAERKPLRAVMWRKCHSYGLVPTGPPSAQRGQAPVGRLPPLQDRRLGPEAALCSRECAQPAVGACVRLGFLRVERAATAPFIPTAAPCPEPVTEEAPPPA